MDWKDVLITQAISTVIAIVRTNDGKGKFRRALMKVFKEIAFNIATEAELREVQILNRKTP